MASPERPRTSNYSRWARRAALALLCGALFAACSSDNSATPLTPSGPLSFALRSSLGCDGLLTVQLVLSNWLMRPPGTCYGTPQCGSARITVAFADGTPSLVTTTAAATAVVDLRPYQAATLQSLQGRSDAITATLLDDAGNPFDMPRTSGVDACSDGGIGAAGAAGAAGASGAGGTDAGTGTGGSSGAGGSGGTAGQAGLAGQAGA